jgi:hypothetical protein
VVFAVNDLGVQPRYQDEGAVFQYAIGLEFPLADDVRTLWITANGTLHPKSTLGKLTAATGVKLSGSRFDPESLIGANFTAITENVNKNGQIYANVVGFSKLAKDLQPVLPKTPATAAMPQWLQNKLANRLDKKRDLAVVAPCLDAAINR